MTPILEACRISKSFHARRNMFDLFAKPRSVIAVDDVNLELYPDEAIGLVGETGSGKTTLGMILAQLAVQTEGKVLYRGLSPDTLSASERHSFRRSVQVIFQDPRASLNPRKRIGRIVRDAIRDGGDSADSVMVARLLNTVGLDERLAARFPHELSGGQQQRVGIARALAPKPEVIIADEPVSALDVSVQAQIINLLKELQGSFRLTLLIVAHDLALVQRVCRRVAVMYFGRIVEIGTVDEVFGTPKHPYTQALLASVPRISAAAIGQRPIIEGEPPDPYARPSGCIFHSRCPKRMDKCINMAPVPTQTAEGRTIECHLYGKDDA